MRQTAPYAQSQPLQQYSMRQPLQQQQSPQQLKFMPPPSSSQVSRQIMHPQPMNYPYQQRQSEPQLNSSLRITQHPISVIQTQPTQNQQIHYIQSHQIEPAIQVVDLSQVEEPWRQKVYQLEEEISQLKLNKPNQILQVDNHQDDDKEAELSSAYSQIQQLINTLKNLQEEIQVNQQTIDNKQRLIDELQQGMSDKEKDIEELQNENQMLQQQIDDYQNMDENKQRYLIEEVNTWKKKFVDQNKEFHQKQEELMMLQAELDNLRNTMIINKNSDYKAK